MCAYVIPIFVDALSIIYLSIILSISRFPNKEKKLLLLVSIFMFCLKIFFKNNLISRRDNNCPVKTFK